jgi:hypothetical protein
MNLYRQSIALFGIALPILGLVVLLGVCFLLKSKMTASFENKSRLFKSWETSRRQALEIETKIVNQRGYLNQWTALLAEESSSAVNSHLREIAETLPSKEFQKAGFDRTAGGGGFGSAIAQNSSQIRLALRGTYRTLQRAFLELESRMPQLQLQELRITPNAAQENQTPLLNIQVVYTAWEN